MHNERVEPKKNIISKIKRESKFTQANHDEYEP